MIAGAVIVAVTLSQVAAPEDIGIVFRSSAGTAEVVAACPRIAVVDAPTGGADLVRTFLATCPGTEAVFQLPAATQGTPTVSSLEEARIRADQYWALAAPTAQFPSVAERARVWVEGPADFDSFPSWRNDTNCLAGALLCATDFVGAFWAELDGLAHRDGFRGLVLPPFAPQPGDLEGSFCALLRGIEAGLGFDVAWTWDAVSPGMALQAEDEATTTFGYRGVRAACPVAQVHPLLVRVSVSGGWRSRATTAQFLDWLRFLDLEVDADPDPFLGLAVFGFGTGDGNDLAPIATELAAFLIDPTEPPPDDGGGGSNGGKGPFTPPPGQPGSNLGPDRGNSFGGCSTTGGGSLSLVALAALAQGARGRRRGGRT